MTRLFAEEDEARWLPEHYIDSPSLKWGLVRYLRQQGYPSEEARKECQQIIQEIRKTSTIPAIEALGNGRLCPFIQVKEAPVAEWKEFFHKVVAVLPYIAYEPHSEAQRKKDADRCSLVLDNGTTVTGFEYVVASSVLGTIIYALRQGEEIDEQRASEWGDNVTKLYLLMDPRLPDDVQRYIREKLDGKFFLRHELQEAWQNPEGFLTDGEAPVLEVHVFDELGFFKHFIPQQKRKAARRTWEKLRDEMLERKLRERESLHPFYIMFCKKALLQKAEGMIKEAEGFWAKRDFETVALKCRKAIEIIFSLIANIPENAHIKQDTIWEHKDIVVRHLSEPAFYDIVNVRKASDLLHPSEKDKDEDAARITARDIINRARNVMDILKENLCPYLSGLPFDL